MKNTVTLFNDEHWSPFRLATGFDRLWDELAGASEEQMVKAFTPACDVQETQTHYLLSLDVPGVSKQDIKLEISGNKLLISGERKEEKSEKEAGRYFMERSYGKFQRAFTLGDNVDASKIEAAYKDGVLHVVVPKSEAAKPRTIEVREDDKGGFFQKFLGKKPEEKHLN